jgi:hypothetical protein
MKQKNMIEDSFAEGAKGHFLLFVFDSTLMISAHHPFLGSKHLLEQYKDFFVLMFLMVP